MTLNSKTKRVSDVLEHVKRQFGDESGAQINDPDIIRWLNQAQQEANHISRIVQSKATSTTVLRQHTYSAPVEAATDILSVTYDGRPLHGLTFQEFNNHILRADPGRTEEGVPLYWTVFNNELILWPTPNDALPLTVYFYGTPPLLTGGTDFLGLPDRYYEALIAFVLSKAYELDEDYATSESMREMFRGRLSEDYGRDSEPTELTYGGITILDWS